MDKLAERLKRDATKIETAVSDELERRIDASLRSVAQVEAQDGPPPLPRADGRPALFWWASSLTGIAAAAAVIIVINLAPTDPAPPANVATLPPIELNVEPAMLTEPLREELENLQSDLQKAEEKIKQDIGL